MTIEPLGIQYPLVSPKPLGTSFLQPEKKTLTTLQSLLTTHLVTDIDIPARSELSFPATSNGKIHDRVARNEQRDLIFTPEGFRYESPQARSIESDQLDVSGEPIPPQEPHSPYPTVTTAFSPTPSSNKPYNLEILAQEVYQLLRQRFEIERERQGRIYSRHFFDF